MKNGKYLSISNRLNICFKISKALCFLGSKHVLHRDLNHRNIMFNKHLNPFIIDFGSCAPMHKSKAFGIK